MENVHPYTWLAKIKISHPKTTHSNLDFATLNKLTRVKVYNHERFCKWCIFIHLLSLMWTGCPVPADGLASGAMQLQADYEVNMWRPRQKGQHFADSIFKISAFSWKKVIVFWSKFHLTLFVMVQLSTSHWWGYFTMYHLTSMCYGQYLWCLMDRFEQEICFSHIVLVFRILY